MAFTTILRKSAKSLVPLATRLTRVQRNYHSCIFTALNHNFQSPERAVSRFYRNTLQFSTAFDSWKSSSDESIIRILESEIRCAEESDDYDQVEDPPSGFPFEIEDTPGLLAVTLSREYDGELIKVDVDTPDDESPSKFTIPLVVTFSKKGELSLELYCTASPEEIAINSLTIGNSDEGPEFCDLDENLQKAFHEYLEIRGIKPSITNYLRQYMNNKDNREYIRWLKSLKKYVEE
ncbi:hypothetical protein PTKIN_Ptkin13bG0174100 [Pterospermum kingtungense]